MDRSAGLRNPVKLIKLETILVPKRAATKGIILSNLVPPVLLRTKLLALSQSKLRNGLSFTTFPPADFGQEDT